MVADDAETRAIDLQRMLATANHEQVEKGTGTDREMADKRIFVLDEEGNVLSIKGVEFDEDNNAYVIQAEFYGDSIDPEGE